MAFRISGTWKVVRAFFRREEAGGSLRLYFCALADVVAARRLKVWRAGKYEGAAKRRIEFKRAVDERQEGQ